MNYLCIQNQGEVDPQAFTLLGASVKEDEAIGFFGSGNKYAIASVLRLGLSLRIFSGETEIDIETKTQFFRGEEFSVIHINDQATSITTRTGPKWLIRDAIREFWSNAKDEGQCSKSVGNFVDGQQGVTRIFVELSHDIETMLVDWNKFFLSDDLVPLDDNRVARIFAPNPANYFRKGVWICEDRASVGYFTYDFAAFDLPESRKVSSYSAASGVNDALRWCNSEVVFETLLRHTIGDICLTEWQALRYTTQNTGVLMRLFNAKYDMVGAEKSKEFLADKTEKRVLWCEDTAYRALQYNGAKTIEELFQAEDCYKLTGWPIGYHEQVSHEINLLNKFGVDLALDSIVFGVFNNSDTIAQYDKNKNLVVLCNKSFEHENLRKSLVEEWTHAKHGCLDGTTHQQHVYLNLICDLINRG